MYKSNKKNLMKLTPIEVIDLSVLLGKDLILDKVSCSIKNNSITAVIGPNGAGKSIFLQTFACTVWSNYCGNSIIFNATTNLV